MLVKDVLKEITDTEQSEDDTQKYDEDFEK